mmetsp:Transcript_8764/g.25127  ORF Transcript_8764/g.25127 Transcript_8764/m.25127 type:complete len:154 (+) Transcript_8764:1402-1863(+)
MCVCVLCVCLWCLVLGVGIGLTAWAGRRYMHRQYPVADVIGLNLFIPNIQSQLTIPIYLPSQLLPTDAFPLLETNKTHAWESVKQSSATCHHPSDSVDLRSPPRAMTQTPAALSFREILMGRQVTTSQGRSSSIQPMDHGHTRRAPGLPFKAS